MISESSARPVAAICGAHFMETTVSYVGGLRGAFFCSLVGVLLAGCTNATAPQDATKRNSEEPAISTKGNQVTELRSKITKWQQSRDKLKELRSRLELERTDILAQLDAMQ